MFSLDLSLLNGNMKSGSMGCSLFNFPIKIYVKVIKDHENVIDCELIGLRERINDLAILFEKKVCRGHNYHIKIITPKILREHIGLGSSTQVCVGLLRALYDLEKIKFCMDDLLRYGVGTVSACGAQLAFNPGFIIEYGYNINEKGVCLHPELYDYREVFDRGVIRITNCEWVLVVAIPRKMNSISGIMEESFWALNYPDTIDNTLNINYYLAQNVLPGLFCKDFQKFIDGMNSIVEIGTKVQEENIQSETTKKYLKLLKEKFGFASISSLGPTIYSFAENRKIKLPKNDDDYIFYKIPMGSFK